MELLPNPNKKLTIEVNNRKFSRYPIKTKLITPEDKDIVELVETYVKKYLLKGDIIFVSEKVVAVTQGRSYQINEIKYSLMASILSGFVTKTKTGIGLGSPQTMQLAIEEVGFVRIIIATILSAATKLFGIKGVFYVIAGNGARSIDGAVDYAIPPYNNYVSKGPKNPDKVAEEIFQKLGVPVAIVDANDLGVNILGITKNLDKKLVEKIIKDNPLGQTNEQTPIGIIREISFNKI